MAGRFIKLYDKILQWEWFQYPNTLCLFIYLLLKANYKETSLRGQVIRRGQVVTSLPKIATDTGLSIRQARTALSHLISTGEVTDESSNQNRVITIVKYDEYQNATDGLTGKRQANDRRADRQTTDEATPCIEYKEKNRNVEPIERESTPAKLARSTVLFDRFWAAYPRHDAKMDARKAFDKLNPDDELMGKILKAIEAWKQTDQWKENGGQFIPYPATWLNKHRWEDEIPAPRNHSANVGKPVSAQQYAQRDYGNKEQEVFDRMMSNLLSEYGDQI